MVPTHFQGPAGFLPAALYGRGDEMTSKFGPAQVADAAAPDLSWASPAEDTRFTPADRRRALLTLAFRLTLVCAGLLGVASLVL
jgi:hypothetical protein